jgi:hypothetical protein
MEKKYIMLDADRFDSIDWSRTYETADTAHWNIERSEFIISADVDSDYLNEDLSYDAYYIRGILADPYWGEVIL